MRHTDDRTYDLMGEALLARLRGKPIAGAASVYAHCSLANLEILCRATAGTPYNVRLAGTSSDFTLLVANTLQKRLLDHLASTRGTARALSRRLRLDDFRATPALAIDPPPLSRVGEGGTVPGGVFGTVGESLALETFARIIALSRYVIVGDDLDALDEVARTAVQSAIAVEDDRFWTLLSTNPTLTDGVALFHATHGNLLPPLDLFAESLAVATAALRAQTSSAGGQLNLDPFALLVGPTLEQKARGLVVSLTPGGESASLRVVVEPRITDARWYLFANPAVRAGIGLGHYRGIDAPTIVAVEGWAVEGIELRITHNFGVQALDHRAVVLTPEV